MTDKILHLDWTACEWEDRTNLNGGADYGIYQIYGDHTVYGTDVLLYIGLAQYQKFSVRLSEQQHNDFIVTHFTRFSKLRIGRFIKSTDINQDNWGEAIAQTERILINSHSPAYNAKEIKGVLDWKTDHIHVFNWGDRGSLMPEVSSRRFSNTYWSMEWEPISE